MSDGAHRASGVASPCTSVCTIDQASGLCAGCARTLDEIASWGGYSDEQKRAVLGRLPARRARLGKRHAGGDG
jgi:predicted Fe-S protein YdhL (DUF1289 family)